MDHKKQIIPLEALFDEGTGPNLSADPRNALRDADVIIGVDVMSRREFVVYGRKSIEKLFRSGKPERLGVMYIGLDQETEELEKLIALVRVVKGHDDYRRPVPTAN